MWVKECEAAMCSRILLSDKFKKMRFARTRLAEYEHMHPAVALANAEELTVTAVIGAADMGDAIVWREVYRASISHSLRSNQVGIMPKVAGD